MSDQVTGSSPVICVVGPTAIGKSDMAVELAQRLDAEIVNLDSMQTYVGMDIGTAKMTLEERRGVPHHLLDIWDIHHHATVAEFQELAREAIGGIHERGHRAVLVGGSGLYVNAVLDDLQFPGTDPQVRATLEADLGNVGSHALHDRLRDLDPVAAESIIPTNGRRIVRALEVIHLRGSFTAELPHEPVEVIPALRIGLRSDRDVLDRRIARRVELMWDGGLVDEVTGLMAAGLKETRTASRALGYPETMAHIDGSMTRDEAIERTAISTRQFARRQMKWFARDSRIVWFDYEVDTDDVESYISDRGTST